MYGTAATAPPCSATTAISSRAPATSSSTRPSIIFEGSKVMDGLVDELVAGAREEMAVVAEQGGAVAAVPYMKTQMVESHRARVQRIESGDLKVIGKNVYTEAEPSPLQAGADGGIL